MKTKYTTGNWEVMPGRRAPRVCVDGDPGWPIVVNVSGPTIAEAAKNEQLIAAAPDLFKALERLVNSPNAKKNDLWDQARAAIKKAVGKAD